MASPAPVRDDDDDDDHEITFRDLQGAILYIFGSALAITISWSQTHSVFAAIMNGLLSWVYVGYYLLTRPS